MMCVRIPCANLVDVIYSHRLYSYVASQELEVERAQKLEEERRAKIERDLAEQDAAAARANERESIGDRTDKLVEQLKVTTAALKTFMEGCGHPEKVRKSKEYAQLNNALNSAKDALEEKCSDGTSNLISVKVTECSCGYLRGCALPCHVVA